MSSSSFEVDHVRIQTPRPFGDVAKRLESRLGRFDPATLPAFLAGTRDPADADAQFEAMAGPTGLMLFGAVDHGSLLAVYGKPRRAVQYTLGNPAFAVQMTRHDPAAALYAPLRLLVYESEGATVLEYDKPSSLFGQFHVAAIDAVATMLDRKLEALVETAIA